MRIESTIVTYKDVLDSLPNFVNDSYGIASYYNESRRQAFIHNPNLKDNTECAMVLESVDGVIAGRVMHFPTQLLFDGNIHDCISGSALEVAEPYRHDAVGADLMMFPVFKDKREFVIAAGISEQALPMYKKLKYTIFDYQRCLKIKNFIPLFKSKRLPRPIASILGTTFNNCSKLYYKIVQRKPRKEFFVRNVTEIPTSIDEISLSNRYKFMEMHDHKWLQWNLDYNFSENSKNKKNFYIISDGKKDIGFFMLKETYRKKAGWINDVVIGSIVEWDSIDKDILSETDIYNIAMRHFSPEVDIIEIASSDEGTIKDITAQGFLKFRLAHIVFKDKKKKYPEAKDINNWRIRLGYADVIFT